MHCDTRRQFDFSTGGHIAQASALVSVAVGALVLIGWMFEIETLKSVLPGLVSMKANTALSFVLLGIALGMTVSRGAKQAPPFAAQAAALPVMLIAAGTLIEYGYGWNLGLDEALFKEPPGAVGTISPGRMSPISAINFFMLAGAAFWLRSTQPWVRRMVQVCLALPFVISVRASVGYFYGLSSFPLLGQSSSMALHTAITFLIVCIGFLYSRPDFEFVAAICSRRRGGKVARRIIPAVLTLPVLFGAALLHVNPIGEYPQNIGVTLYTISMLVLLVSVVGWAASSINKVDDQRDKAQRAVKQFRRLSECDALTGLLNRRSFLANCDQVFRNATLSGRPYSCIILDIDFFKQINDSHGHSVGDAVLCHVSRSLTEHCRNGDKICRYGGEEFCIVLPDTHEADGVALAERLRTQIAADPITLSDSTLRITLSLGVAELTDSTPTVQSVIDRADEALLVAKRSGRDRVVNASSLDEAHWLKSDSLLSPLAGLQVQDVMLPGLACVALTDTVSCAAKFLFESQMDSIPVIDGHGKLAGVVSDRDVMSALLGSDTSAQPINSLIRRSEVAYEYTTPAIDVARFLCRTSVARVLIVHDGKPVGAISRSHLLRWLHHALLSQEQATSNVDAARYEREELDRAVESLIASAERLSGVNHLSPDKITACIVGETTKIQELFGDLISRFRVMDRGRLLRQRTVMGAKSFV